MAGLGNVSKHLSEPRLTAADLYAEPSSADGRNLTIALGFEPTPSYQQELWRYERPWNRVPSKCRHQSTQQGVLQMHGTKLPSSTNPDSRRISIRIARDPNDLMLVTAIRSAVYLAEQDCPIEEEFDGNDLVAAHFIGFVGTEPAGCLRVRFFGEFAKVERLAVRHQFRRSRVSFKLVQASVDYVKRKGFRKIYGQAQDRLVAFWAHFGAKPLGHNRKITFSDFSYTEMVLDIEPGPDAITLDSDPYVIIRPGGRLGPAWRARHLVRPRRDVAAAHRVALSPGSNPAATAPGRLALPISLQFRCEVFP